MTESLPPLDPELRRTIERGRASELPPWHTMSVEEARRVEDEVFSAGGGPVMAGVEDRAIDAPGGSIPVRIYEPESEDRLTNPPPALVFFHGGGWVLGTLDSADDLCRELAARIGAVVVSVDYRLAPEHPFPAPFEDAWAGLEWTVGNASEIGADPGTVLVAGSSAGGGLAAATALRARDQGIDLAAQVLLYPMLTPGDDPAGSCGDDAAESSGDDPAAPLLTEDDVGWFWDLYLSGAGGDPGDPESIARENPHAAPLLADTLDGVAPAVIATGGHDVLAREGAAYADRLRSADVDVVHCNHPSLSHGFLSFTDEVERAEEAAREITHSTTGLLDLGGPDD